MDRQLAPGMERLVSEDGGGVELPSLFSGIMSAAYKKKSVTLEDAERTLNPAIHHPERMQLLYDTATEEEGVSACLRAVLGQLVLRRLLKEAPDGTWALGDNFVTDQWLDVLEGEPGDWMRVIVWSQTSDKPSPGMLRDRAREKSRAEIKALASLLEPEKDGLRKTNQTIVKHIKRDYAERGIVEDRPEFKILRDQNGRILDGRNRLQAAKDLGITWPEETIEVHSDEEALRIAVQRNRSHMFDAKLLKSLADKGLTWINTTGKRELIRLELLADHERSDSEIARVVGCSDKTVAAVRSELEQTSEPDRIPKFTLIHGRQKDEALRARVRAALEENSKRANNAIARIVECSYHLVADVRAEMENEGTVEQYRSTRGRRPSTVQQQTGVKPVRRHTGPEIDEARVEQMLREGHGRSAIHVALGFSKKAHNSRLNTVLNRIEGRLEQERQAVAAERAVVSRDATISEGTSPVTERPIQHQTAPATTENELAAPQANGHKPPLIEEMTEGTAQLSVVDTTERDRAEFENALAQLRTLLARHPEWRDELNVLTALAPGQGT